MDFNVVMFTLFIIGLLLLLIYAYVNHMYQKYKYSHTEFLLFALLLNVTGAAILLAPILQGEGNAIAQIVGLLFVIIGFLIGAFGFFKKTF